MLISIVIPTYKRPEFLKRAINSVLSQTYKDIEIIVVSDNEEDDEYENQTRKIIEGYQDEPRVIYVPGEGNFGGCHARNKGLEKAKGAYVNFLDDDDVMLPEKLEKQVAALNAHGGNVAVVGCCAAIINRRNCCCMHLVLPELQVVVPKQ